MARHPIRILGIDPGLRRTGWGLIESDGNRLIYIGCGSFDTDDRAEGSLPASRLQPVSARTTAQPNAATSSAAALRERPTRGRRARRVTMLRRYLWSGLGERPRRCGSAPKATPSSLGS